MLLRLVALLVCVSVFGCHDRRGQQLEHLERNQPKRYRSVETTPTATQVVRVRAYVDDSYVQETMRWEEHIKEHIELATTIAEPQINTRFELVGIQRWHPQSTEMTELMDAIAKLDEGKDAEVIVAYTGSFGGLTRSHHNLGLGDVLGKHMVLRAMNKGAEWQQISYELDALSEDEQRGIFRERIRQKEAIAFLHEFGHLNGAIHTVADGWFMAVSYDRHHAQYNPTNADIIKEVLRLRHEHKDRGDLMRAAAAKIRVLTSGQSSHGLEQAALDSMLTLEFQEEMMGRSTYESVQAARELANEMRFQEALVALAPAMENAPDNPGVLRVQCYVMVGLGQETKALEVCSRAADRNPTDYFAPLNAAVALQRMEKWDESLVWTQKAQERLEGSERPQVSEWSRVANAYANAFALDLAEKALGKVPPPVSSDELSDRLKRLRQLTCMPAGAMSGMEERAAVVEGQSLMDSVFRNKAERSDIEAFQKKFPDAPMGDAAQCVRDLKRRGARANLSFCDAAIQRHNECWPVQYSLGLHFVQRRNWARAQPHLEQAHKIQPDEKIKRHLDEANRRLAR